MENTFNEIFIAHGFQAKKKFYGYTSYYNKDKDVWGQIDLIARTIELNDKQLKYSVTELINEINKLKS